MEPTDNKLLRPNIEEYVGSSTLHAAYPEQVSIKQDGSCPHDATFISSPIPLPSYHSFASHGDFSKSSDDSSDGENEPSSFDDKDEIWDPPDAENDEDNYKENSMAALDDKDDESADGDGEGSAKLSSLNCFEEGVSNSYRFKVEKQKAVEEMVKGKFKSLVRRLLEKHCVDNCDKKDESWVEIVMHLAWQAVLLFVDPDACKGNTMDHLPSGYVKIKCIASGSRSESQLIKGLVFTKHAAHKNMATKHKNPILLLIRGMLGQSSDSARLPSLSSMLHSSVNSKIHQNEENITGLLEILKACHTNVILVEKSASRDVLNEVLKLGVTLVLDMNLHRLQRVARSTASPIISSYDVPLVQTQKHCDSLYFETFVEEHAVGKGGTKPCKTLMFIEGCPRLGCTILLKGSQSEELKKIKDVVRRAVVMAYHLILENSFLVDQKAMFSTITRATAIMFDDDHSTSPVFEISDSPCDKEPRIHSTSTDGVQVPVSTSCDEGSSRVQEATSETALKGDKALHSDSQPFSAFATDAGDAKKVEDGEERIQPRLKNSIVFDSESTLVLMTSQNAFMGTICVPSHTLDIKFNRNSDVPLAKFLRNNIFDQCMVCGGLPEAHVYYYAHCKKHLTIRVKRLDDKKTLPRESEGRIWIWSCCGICEPDKQKATKRVLLSTAAHGLSFGKFLELSFSSNSTFNRLSSCGHSFRKDFLNFFGLGSMVAMFQYSRCATYTLSVPAQKLRFNSSTDKDWLQQEIESVCTMGLLLFTEVANYLKKIEFQFTGSNLVLNSSLKVFADIVDMVKLERSEFEENIKNIGVKNESLTNSVHKVLSLNWLRLEILLQACVWDLRLQSLLSSWSTLVCSTSTVEQRQMDISEKPASPPLSDSEDSRGWMWNSFAQIREECKKDLHRGYLPKFGHLTKFELLHFHDFFPTVSRLISQEYSRLHIPITNTDYIVSDYDGEISSYVACALALMKDLCPPVSDIDKNTTLKCALSEPSIWSLDSSGDPDVIHPGTMLSSENPRFSCFNDLNLLGSLVSYEPFHPEVTLGLEKYPMKGKYSVVIRYASEFRGLRNRCCPSELDYIASLARCKIWNKGGKGKSFLAKTLDDRLIIKEIKKTELESFMKFSPDYFGHMKQSFDSGNQTCLAKILGIYQVTIRDAKSGKETKHGLMVQENLFFGKSITRQHDLKGPILDQFTATSDDTEDVLLDQNFVSDMSSSPLYIVQKSKRVLQRALWNDKTFLNSINVMDYSLLVGVDRRQRQLVCGIIDYLRQCTWDKQLETWLKTSICGCFGQK